MEFLVLSIILLPILTAAGYFPLQKIAPRYLGIFSAWIALFAFAGVVILWKSLDGNGSQTYEIPWVPSAGINLSFLVDGLSLFFAGIVSGMGVLVSYYANDYMDPADKALGRFYCCLNLFMGCMLGAVFADNLLLMFIFWELTGVASFLLIGYHFQEQSSCSAARMSFLVTSLTGLFLLIGILLIGVLDHTFLWTEVVINGIAYGDHPLWPYVVMICFLIGIFGKSAQIPFHFWLPKAMAAPTPVSAYLHAATMVKLGIYLTARMYPLFVDNPLWFPVTTTVCFTTMLVGAFFSLVSNDLKAILAYATISQLGFFIGFYGMGDADGVQYDFIHILNHALYKGSLFMLVGIIAHATGIRDIRYLGGLWKKMPFVGVIFLIAVAAMAGLPGTTGFLSKEMMLSDVVMLGKAHRSGVVILLTLFTALLFKAAFSLRLFTHLFLRRPQQELRNFHSPSFQILVPPFILSSIAFIFGLWPEGLENLSQSFFVSGLHKTAIRELSLWHGWTIELLISAVVFGLGALLFLAAEKINLWDWKFPGISATAIYYKCLNGIQSGASALTDRVHIHRPDTSLAVVAGGFSFGLGGIILHNLLSEPFKATSWSNDPLSTLTAFFLSASSISILFFKSRFARLIALSIAGFLLTLYFVFHHAPDLAMTQLLVEVVTLFILLMLFWTVKETPRIPLEWGKLVIAIATGCTASLIALTFRQENTDLKTFMLSNSLPLVHGANAVNAILVDFRGLDTFGEITVVVIMALGIAGLLASRTKPWATMNKQVTLIPSTILRFVTPVIFIMTMVFSFYLLLRGHHLPGGGFIAGLIGGIGFVILSMTRQIPDMFRYFRLPLMKFSYLGLLIMGASSLLPLFFGYNFLEHHPEIWGISWNTPLLFEIGVYLSVLGVSIMIVLNMRNDALGREDRP